MHYKLYSHVRTGKQVRLERQHFSDRYLNGYLLDVSEELGLIHCINAFEPDGYSVFRIADVSNIRSGKYERHWDRMLAGEGLLDGTNLDATIDITSMCAAIDSISRQYHGLIIECEKPTEDEDDFYIGQATSHDNLVVRFNEFDALGQWEASPTSIPVDEITLLQFETPYFNRFWKYLSGSAPNEIAP